MPNAIFEVIKHGLWVELWENFKWVLPRRYTSVKCNGFEVLDRSHAAPFTFRLF